MSPNKYKWILYLIILVIISTIGIQVYWNYKNYQVNRQQLINDVQSSLDNAVDTYYTALAQNTTIGFSFDEDFEGNFLEDDGVFDSIIGEIDSLNAAEGGIKSLEVKPIEGVHVYRGVKADSMLKKRHKRLNPDGPSSKRSLESAAIKKDSTRIQDFQMLTSKVIISINSDTLKLDEPV